ncbi:charged multivesicular body protein 7 [Lycorma delicatula]|uniref:charged multivesicular body protein 7 n=1 Tax=Lycorma delicatula TaxID=130591 RepID=UPI003F515CED
MNISLQTLPKDWNNDIRMNSLFAPFRKRELNPIDYESKMLFWKNSIDTSLYECGCCSFTVEELEKAFVREGRKPACIGEVIDNLLRDGDIKYQSDFEALIPSENTWTSWAVKSLVTMPLKWSFDKLKDALVSCPPTNYEQRFVHMSAIKRKANDLLMNINDELKGIILTMDQLVDGSKECSIKEHDLPVIVHWLELQGLATVTVLDNKKLVKLAQNGKKFEQITEADKATLSLRNIEKQLTTSIEGLEIQRQESIQEAKNYLKKGMRPMAKSYLRKKKEFEKQIDKHVTALDNIHVLLARIHDTESNSKVFESYKMSLSALKYQFKEVGLTEDNVSNTMAQVQEVLDIHDDIQTMLGEPASNVVTSDEDYEAELEEILKSKEPELPKFSPEKFDLPEPPSESPKSYTSSPKTSKEVQQIAI